MNVRNIDTRAIEVVMHDRKILFSYDVAVGVFDSETGQAAIPNEPYSKTTTRHINKWLKANDVADYLIQTRTKEEIISAVAKM